MSACENCGAALAESDAVCPQCGDGSPAQPQSSGFETAANREANANFGSGSGLGLEWDAATDSANARAALVEIDQLLRQIGMVSHFEERYQLDSKALAVGEMGKIHRAFDRILNREVAVKLRREDKSDSLLIRSQFLKEARIGGRLCHPNVVPVFDLGVNRAGLIYYSMRLVKGKTLQDCLNAMNDEVVPNLFDYPLKNLHLLEGFVKLLVLASQAVDHAHENGILHLDLKPSNILMSGFSEVFVVDWGLAKVDDVDDAKRLVELYSDRSLSSHSFSMTGIVQRNVGTLRYMAPEQIQGDFALLRPTADIYGLGGLLHFILYGKAPNCGESANAIIKEMTAPKARGPLRSCIRPRGQRVSKPEQAAVEGLEDICLKALAPNPDERHQGVDELIVDLKEWLTNDLKPLLSHFGTR